MMTYAKLIFGHYLAPGVARRLNEYVNEHATPEEIRDLYSESRKEVCDNTAYQWSLVLKGHTHKYYHGAMYEEEAPVIIGVCVDTPFSEAFRPFRMDELPTKPEPRDLQDLDKIMDGIFSEFPLLKESGYLDVPDFWFFEVSS